jgi:hypothetical protein
MGEVWKRTKGGIVFFVYFYDGNESDHQEVNWIRPDGRAGGQAAELGE